MKNSQKDKIQLIAESAEMHRHIIVRALFVVLVLGVVLLGFIPAVFGQTEPISLVVDIAENKPLAFFDEDGKPAGFYVDLLNYVAGQEGWILEFVDLPRDQMLEMADQGEVDIIATIGYSEPFWERYIYTEERLLDNWGVVYVRSDSKIESILDFNGLTVALLQPSTHGNRFRELLNEFGIESQIIETSTFAEVAELLERGEVDAGILNRLIGYEYEAVYNIKPTTIIFNPIDVRIAASPKTAPFVIETIDAHLAELKNNPDSFYYQSFSKWFEAPEQDVFPQWVTWTLISSVGLLAVLSLISMIFRSQLKARTADLMAKNLALESEVEEHHKTQLALQTSEKKYRELVDLAQEGIWVIDNASYTTFVNPSMAKMLGYRPDEMVGNHLLSFMGEGEAENFTRNVAHRELGIAEQHDFELLRKDGTRIYTTMESAALIDENGQYAGVIAGVIDITERKQAEGRLLWHKERLEEAEKRAKLGSWEFSVASTQEGWWSKQMFEMLGLDPTKGIPSVDDYLEAIHPEDRHIIQDVLFKMTQGQEPVPQDFRSNPERGPLRYFRPTVHCERDGQGSPVKFIGTLQDITERQKAEEALRESEEKFATIFKAAPGSIILSSLPDGKTVEVNDNFFLITGYTRAEALGKTTGELGMWADPSALDRFLSLLRSDGIVRDFEADLNHKSGTIHNGLVSGHIITIRGKKHLLSTFYDITERKQAEKALRQSEERFRTVLANSNTIVAIADRDLRYTWIHNPHPDFDPATTIGKRDDELAQNDGVVKLAELKQQVIDTEQSAQGEVTFPLTNGSITYAISAEPLRNDARRVIGVTTVATDITDRKQAEQALRDIAENMATAQRVAHFGSWEIALNDDLAFVDPQLWSDECYRIFGVEPGSAEITTDLFYRHVHQDDREVASQALRKAIQERTEASYEYRLIRPDGSIRNLHDQVNVVLDEHTGLPVKVIGTVQDITERKQAQEKLRESEFRYRQLLEVSPVGVAVHSAGKVVFANPAGARLLGAASPIELIGKAITNIIHPDGLQAATDRIQRMLNGEKGLYPVEDRYVRLDGSIVPVEVMAVPLTYEGQPAVQVMVTDITERKQAEEALQRYNERLTILRQIDQDILVARTFEGILQPVIQGIRQLIQCTRIDIALFDMVALEITIFELDSTADTVMDAGQRLPFKRSQRVEQLQAGQVIVIPDFESHKDSEFPETITKLMNEGLRSGIHIPLIAQDQLIGMFSLLDVTPNHFTAEHQEIAGEVANQLAIALYQNQLREQIQRHTEELEQRVAERTAELEQQYRRQAALAEIELAINQPHELQAVLNRIAEITTEVLPATLGASVTLWDTATETFSVSATTIPRLEPEMFTQHTRPQGGVTRWIVDSQRPFIVADIKDDPFQARRIMPDYGARAYAGIPLLAKGDCLGVLFAFDQHPRQYTSEELDFLTALANRASVGISKVRMYEQAQELAALKERQRLARDLHDAVSQMLFSASIMSETLPRLWERNPQAVGDGLVELHLMTRGALAEMRTLLLELRPQALAKANLSDLLRQLTQALTGRARTKVSLTVSGKHPLPPDIKIALYRITQEAFNNITRHAHASAVSVKLDSQPGKIILYIHDDGRGFNPNDIPPDHLGVQIMQERAKEAGASFQLISAPGQGTEIRVIWPNQPEGTKE